MRHGFRVGKDPVEYQLRYPVGTRLVLIWAKDNEAPISAGTRGTVEGVDVFCRIHVYWDNGCSFVVAPGVDSFRKLTEKELEEEKKLALDNIDDAAEKQVVGNNKSKNSVLGKRDVNYYVSKCMTLCMLGLVGFIIYAIFSRVIPSSQPESILYDVVSGVSALLGMICFIVGMYYFDKQ